jgi:sphingomyelin phosphodiesterase acid-like 3
MGTFLWLSDFHLDPYYGRPSAASTFRNSDNVCTQNSTIDLYRYGHVGCDAPNTLINELLQHVVVATSSNEKNDMIDFVLVTGDFSRHATDHLDDGITETATILFTVSKALKDAFPNIPIIPCIGNNDVYPDYTVDLEKGSDSNIILNISLEGFDVLFDSEEERQSFARGAYYARNVSESLTILTLNTVMYSVNHSPDQTFLDDPMGQFSWLEKQLHVASQAGKFVYILAHIPPTIGSFRHTQFWHDKYLARYFAVLQGYQDSVVRGHLFGHLHSDEFRLLQPPSSLPFNNKGSSLNWTIPLYIASSVTPVYGSNPSYRLVQYDTHSGQLLDYRTFYLDLEKLYANSTTKEEHSIITTTPLPQWTEELPSFANTYNLKDMSSKSLQTLLSRLSDPTKESSQDMWQAFIKRQYVSSSTNVTSCDNDCRSDWLCTIQAVSKKDYTQCVSATKINPVTKEERWIILSTVFILGMMLLITLCCLCFFAYQRFLKRRHFLQIGQSENNNRDHHQDGSISGDIETTSAENHDHEDMMYAKAGEMT